MSNRTFAIETNPCSPETLAKRQALTDAIERKLGEQPTWVDAPSVSEYRKWREEGTNGFSRPAINPNARMITIPSSHGDHSIPLRVVPPSSSKCSGVFLHFHAGGFVVGSALGYDSYLSRLANELSLNMVSVEYRLAPEHIYPTALDDCVDAALFALSETAVSELGGNLEVIGGESAGACLALQTAIQLRDRGIDIKSRITALALSYGWYDLSLTPSTRLHQRRIVLGLADARASADAYLPPDRYDSEKRRDPKISPLYDDLRGLPSAFFLCGDNDPLLDDSMFTAARYHQAGNRAAIKIIPEGFHGFTLFPARDMTEEGIAEVVGFLQSRLM